MNGKLDHPRAEQSWAKIHLHRYYSVVLGSMALLFDLIQHNEEDSRMTSMTRRTFMISTAALAAAGRAVSASDTINVAIIGCRNRGPQVAESMRTSGQFNLAAVCDCDDTMIKRALFDKKFLRDLKQEKDFRRILEMKDIDAVVLAVPDHWHALMTVMALAAGKHVYCEKPASYNIADGKAMVAAQEKHPNLVVQVGSQQRSGPHFQEAKAFLETGGLGKVAFCRACIIHEREPIAIIPDSEPPKSLDYAMWLGPAPYRPFNTNRVHYNWHFMRDTGTGEVGNWAAHWVDIVLWSLNLGFPASAMGLGGSYVVKDAKEWPDTQTVLFEYPEMTLLWEQRLWSTFGINGKGGCHCEFSGEKGSLIISRSGWTFFPRGTKENPEEHAGSEQEIAHVKNFAESIRGQAKPAAPIQEGHKTATLCHLANIACLLNRRIAFDGEKQMIEGDDEAIRLMARPYRAPWKLEDYS